MKEISVISSFNCPTLKSLSRLDENVRQGSAFESAKQPEVTTAQ